MEPVTGYAKVADACADDLPCGDAAVLVFNGMIPIPMFQLHYTASDLLIAMRNWNIYWDFKGRDRLLAFLGTMLGRLNIETFLRLLHRETLCMPTALFYLMIQARINGAGKLENEVVKVVREVKRAAQSFDRGETL